METHKSELSLTKLILLFAFALSFAIFVGKIRAIAFPFVFSFIFSYLFYPITHRLEKHKIPRHISSFTIVFAFFALVVFAVSFFVPIIAYNIKIFITSLPVFIDYLDENILPKIADKISQFIKIDKSTFSIYDFVEKKAVQNIETFSANVFSTLLQSGSSIAMLASVLLLTPIICYYILSDFEKFVNAFNSIIPLKYKQVASSLQKEIRVGILSYIKGQLIVMLFIGTYYSLCLCFAKINGGIVLGLLTGIFGIVPYFGVFIGCLVGVVLAIYQYGGYVMPLVVVAIFISGQVIDGSFVTPNVIGRKIGINPAIIIFGFLVCGLLFGFWGVLLAVPITLICYILTKFFVVNFYKKSSFYN